MDEELLDRCEALRDLTAESRTIVSMADLVRVVLQQNPAVVKVTATLGRLQAAAKCGVARIVLDPEEYRTRMTNLAQTT